MPRSRKLRPRLSNQDKIAEIETKAERENRDLSAAEKQQIAVLRVLTSN